MLVREKARIVAERVAERIRQVIPRGFGHWGPVWDLVAMPSDVFMDALAEWQTEDSPSTRSKLEAASTHLIDAWAEAARQWTEAGCPKLDEPNVTVDDDGEALAEYALASAPRSREQRERGRSSMAGDTLSASPGRGV